MLVVTEAKFRYLILFPNSNEYKYEYIYYKCSCNLPRLLNPVNFADIVGVVFPSRFKWLALIIHLEQVVQFWTVLTGAHGSLFCDGPLFVGGIVGLLLIPPNYTLKSTMRALDNGMSLLVLIRHSY